jgi:acyl carrier protein
VFKRSFDGKNYMEYTLTRDKVLDVILSSINESSVSLLGNLPCSEIESHVCFVDLGINSISYAEIVTIAMEKLDVNIPLDDFGKTNCIADVVDIFFNRLVLDSSTH